jgi:hypothetical protein
MLKGGSQAVRQQRITRWFFHCLNFYHSVSVYFVRINSVLDTFQTQLRRLFSTINFSVLTSIKSCLCTLSTIPTIRTIKINILLILGGVVS